MSAFNWKKWVEDELEDLKKKMETAIETAQPKIPINKLKKTKPKIKKK